MNPKFNRRFYLNDIEDMAKALLGSLLVRKTDSGTRISGKIVELEIYTQKDDPSSHSYNGKTLRNAVMFGPPGYLYVYFTYGMHYCCNIVCGPEGCGDAILIRALEPVEGTEVMMQRRFGSVEISGSKRFQLTNGPAKLCRALDIDRAMNGADLCGDDIWIEQGETIQNERIGRSTRIGISQAKDHYKRYFIKENPWVSKAGRGIDYLE